jgi:hypothetical protein
MLDQRQYNYYGHNSDALLGLAAVPQTAFNAREKDGDPVCLDNARVQVLQQIRTWADGDDERYIFWLSGWAGREVDRRPHDSPRILRQRMLHGQLFLLKRRRGCELCEEVRWQYCYAAVSEIRRLQVLTRQGDIKRTKASAAGP